MKGNEDLFYCEICGIDSNVAESVDPYHYSKCGKEKLIIICDDCYNKLKESINDQHYSID